MIRSGVWVAAWRRVSVSRWGADPGRGGGGARRDRDRTGGSRGTYDECRSRLRQDLAAGALAGRRLTVEMRRSCWLAPGSPAAETIWEAARELALRHAREGRIWAAIGVDYCPCPQNCSFCSFGEKWGIVRDSHEWSLEQIVAAGKSFAAQGAAFITIRTTQHYPLEQVCGIAEALRAAIQDAPSWSSTPVSSPRPGRAAPRRRLFHGLPRLPHAGE